MCIHRYKFLSVWLCVTLTMSQVLPNNDIQDTGGESDDISSESSRDQSLSCKPQKMQNLSIKQTSLAWKHYTKYNNTSAKCCFCDKIIKHSGNTTNLMQHLSRKHEILVSQAKKRKCDFELFKESSKSIDETLQVFKRKKPQSNESRIDYAFSKIKSFEEGGQTADRITLSIMYMIAVDKLPLSTVEAKGFKTLMKTTVPLYNIPSRKTITNIMESRYQIMKEQFKKKIKEAPSYTLTCDNWSDVSNQSYLGVTIHYLEADCEMKNGCLGVLPLDKNHTSDYLHDSLLKVMEDFHVDSNKIMAIISDSAANIRSAVTKLVGSNKQLACFAHILSHLVPKALQSIQSAMEIISKVKKIVSLTRHSIVASDELKRLQKRDGKTDGTILKFIQDVETRWNTTYYMLERFLTLEDYVYPVMLKCTNMPDMLSRTEISVLKNLVALMRPVASVITEISGENYPTCSVIIPIIHCMTAAITDCVITTEIGIEFQEKLLNQINKKFQYLESTRILAISTILDPRFKRLHFKSALAASQAIQDIDSQLKKISNHSHKNIEKENNQDANDEKSSSNLWHFHDNLVMKNREMTDTDESLSLELKQYLHQPVIKRSENAFNYWKSLKHAFPTLSKLALQYLSIISTSVPCERLFSHAGNVKTDNRSRLTVTATSTKCTAFRKSD
ncbi:E3 SUMO-protein ligase ZBED1-like isoform X2 [Linepithema humile]|uniref:E3 SUMO-protein ligase ZBED1-like isoform X2 n=1 Tax=Linepithema humile TaxID=83485 RepID=UPI00351F34C2